MSRSYIAKQRIVACLVFLNIAIRSNDMNTHMQIFTPNIITTASLTPHQKTKHIQIKVYSQLTETHSTALSLYIINNTFITSDSHWQSELYKIIIYITLEDVASFLLAKHKRLNYTYTHTHTHTRVYTTTVIKYCQQFQNGSIRLSISTKNNKRHLS